MCMVIIIINNIIIIVAGRKYMLLIRYLLQFDTQLTTRTCVVLYIRLSNNNYYWYCARAEEAFRIWYS